MIRKDLIKELSLIPFVENPFLEARLILEQEKVSPLKVLTRRRAGEPLSKILGQRGFWSLLLNVSKDVLDPRADSEVLIEEALKAFPDKTRSYSILDLGTGSGCLLLSLLSEYKVAKGLGVDASEKALHIATENACLFKNASFLKASWQEEDFVALCLKSFPEGFDVIVSNPPYIKREDIETLDEQVKGFDPLLALDGGEDGLECYRQLSKFLPLLLKENGRIFLEIGQDQEEDVKALMTKESLCFEEQRKDYGGIVRCLIFSKKV